MAVSIPDAVKVEAGEAGAAEARPATERRIGYRHFQRGEDLAGWSTGGSRTCHFLAAINGQTR